MNEVWEENRKVRKFKFFVKCTVVIVVVFVVTIVAAITMKNFFPKITPRVDNEKYDLWHKDTFYSLVPELISEGKLFDCKFLVQDGSVLNSFAQPPEASSVNRPLLSVISKVQGDFKYAVNIEFYRDENMVYEGGFISLEYRMTFGNIFSATSNPYYSESVLLANVSSYLRAGESIGINRVVLRFKYYDNGKKIVETHDMSYDKELANRFFFEVIEKYCENYDNDSYKKYQPKLYVEKYMASICNNNFELWKDNMDLLVNEAKENGSDSWHLIFLKEFHANLFPEQEISIETENLEVYENIRNEISSLISNEKD